ncbi:MAG: 3'-5' exonuclease [Candidatus Colwellbacteria bacterium]|nr:3'-5' exonuclease [Candidatus Colwellbacteria bacterium]
MKIKECFIDTETTSVDVTKAGVWEIGGIIRIDGKEKERFCFNCDIFDDDEVDLKALEMNGMTIKDLAKFPDPFDTYKKLIDILDKYVDRYDKTDKFFFMGYGAEFDAKILRRWFEGMGDQFFGARFFSPWICVMTIAAHYLMKDRYKMENFKLHSVLKHLGISYDDSKLHNALYDAEMAMSIYDQFKLFKNY